MVPFVISLGYPNLIEHRFDMLPDSGVAVVALLRLWARKTAKNSERTASRSLFFHSSNCRRPSISAENRTRLADNLPPKQQKRPDALMRPTQPAG
jgi:hypothetical protein